jgi:hypothetical protein
MRGKSADTSSRSHFEQLERNGVVVQAKMIEELLKEKEKLCVTINRSASRHGSMIDEHRRDLSVQSHRMKQL